ncbi:Uncharacterised protein g3757 [Pycnogonum litorale]
MIARPRYRFKYASLQSNNSKQRTNVEKSETGVRVLPERKRKPQTVTSKKKTGEDPKQRFRPYPKVGEVNGDEVGKKDAIQKRARDSSITKREKHSGNLNSRTGQPKQYPKLQNRHSSRSLSRPGTQTKIKSGSRQRSNERYLTPNKYRQQKINRSIRSESHDDRKTAGQRDSRNRRRPHSADGYRRRGSNFSWHETNTLKYHEPKEVQTKDAPRQSSGATREKPSYLPYPKVKRDTSEDRGQRKTSPNNSRNNSQNDVPRKSRSFWSKKQHRMPHANQKIERRHSDPGQKEEPSKDESQKEENSPVLARSNSFRSVNGTRTNMNKSANLPSFDSTAGFAKRGKSTRAKMVTFYKNGDALFSGLKVSLTFSSMEALNDYLTARANIPNGARYIFTLDGRRISRLEQLEHDGLYVVSGTKNFENLPYGQQKVNDWQRNGIKVKAAGLRSADLQLIRPLPKTVQKLPNSKLPFNTSGGGLNSTMAGPGSRDGRVIQVINNLDHSIWSRVLLNLKTSQMFTDVLEDLGHVLKMKEGTPKKLYTTWGQEVQSFSQLRNDLKDVDTFYLCTGESHSKQEKISAKSDPGFYTIDSAVPGPGPGPVNYRHEYGKTKEEPVNPFQPVRVTINGVNGVRKEVTKRFTHQADITRPDKRLRVDWVHGYQGQRGTNNLLVLPSGEMVYYVAAVVVLYHRHHNSQRHYLGHTEDVTCMALHPFSEVIATGQRSGKTQVTLSHVRIWDPETLTTHAILGLNEFDYGIESLCFGDNSDGTYLAVVDSSEEHVMSVWNWRDEIVLGKASAQREVLSGVAFHPSEENLIITYGKQHLCIWKRHKDGIFDRSDIVKPQHSTKHVTALQFSPDGDIIAGDTDGYLTIYTRTQDEPDGTSWFVSKEFRAHEKNVSTLFLLSEGTLLSIGGHDRNRQVKAWDAHNRYRHITQSSIPPSAGAVVSMYPQKPGSGDGDIYIGTSRNMIMEGCVQRKFKTVVQGHYKPVTGIASHPQEISFISVAHDRNVFKWSSEQIDWKVQVESDCNAVAVHPNGNVVSVACVNGKVVVLNIDNGMHVATIPITNGSVSTIKYSPDGSFMAIGSQLGNIYIYTSLDKGFSYRRYNTLKGKIPIATIDWSADGLFLQAAATDNTLAFWDIRSPQQIRDPSFTMDMDLHTQSSVMGYSLQGIWDNDHVKSESINLASARSSEKDIVAVGDNEGYIRLFRYPCFSRKAAFYEEKQYSSHISCLDFLRDDAYMVSVGGLDGAIIKWAVLATANTAMY